MKHNFDEFKVGNWYYEALNKRIFECVKICDDYIFSAGCNNTTCMTLEYIKSRPCYEIESPEATFRKGDTVYRSDDDSFHYLSHDNWNYYKNNYQNSYILKRKEQEKEKCPVCGSVEWVWQSSNGYHYNSANNQNAVRSCCANLNLYNESLNMAKTRDIIWFCEMYKKSIKEKSLDLSLYDDDYYTM